MIPTRQSLLIRLKNWEDQKSWREFFETYWRLIYGRAINAGLTDAEAQDVVQETFIAVAKSLPSFKYKEKHGSFKSWLLHLTRWRIADQLRQREEENRAAYCAKATQAQDTEPAADPASYEFEAIWDEEWEECLREAAFERVKGKVNPKMYQIFDAHILQDWPLEKVMQVFEVSRGYVYLTKHRVGRLIKKSIAHLKSKPI